MTDIFLDISFKSFCVSFKSPCMDLNDNDMFDFAGSRNSILMHSMLVKISTDDKMRLFSLENRICHLMQIDI